METLMSNAKPLDLSLPYQVADISLADFGKKEMQLSEREMPGLMELIRPSRASKSWARCT